MNLTVDVLRIICTNLPKARAIPVVAALNQVCPLYGIDSPDVLHEFIANLAEESGEFTRYEENLHYTAQRLTEVWPTRFRNLAEAAPYANNPRKLAEKVYGMRADLGNEHLGDGWVFRGGGPIQTTGRRNYTNFATWMRTKFNITKTAQEWAELIRNDHVAAMHSACWIFAIAKGLVEAAINDQMLLIVRRINGGTTGLSKRMLYYDRAKRAIV